ncbi:MAG: lipopolysaccharide biosynthesis protein [Gemmatimonadota bacterium]
MRTAALRGTIWSAVQQFGDRAIRFPVYLILARLLSPEAFGLVALSAAYVDFLQLFRNLGITAAVVQRERLEPEHLDSAFWGGLALGLVMGLLGYASAGVFAVLAGQSELEPIIRWLSIAFVLSSFSAVQDAILRRELRFQALAIRSIVGQTVATAVAIVAAIRGLGVWSLVLMLLVHQAAMVFLLWRASAWRPAWRFSWARYRELLAFGVPMLGFHVVRFTRMRADNFLIGMGLGAAPLGYYSVALQVVDGMWALVNGSVLPVLWSTLSRLQGERQRLSRAIEESTEMLALATWPVFLGLASVAPYAVPLMLGSRWTASAPILAALAVGAVARSLSMGPLTALSAIGETKWRLGVELIVALLTLGAMVAGLPWGVVVVAWAYTLALFVASPVQLGISLRFLELRGADYLEVFRVPAIASLIMLGVVMLTRLLLPQGLADLPSLVVLVGVGAIVYWGIVRLAAPVVVRRAVENFKTAVRTSRRVGEEA